MNYNLKYPPQHTNKCYCNCGCRCVTPDKKTKQSTNEFIKVRGVGEDVKFRVGSNSEAATPSRSQSKCSAHSLTELSSNCSKSINSKPFCKQSHLELSEQRLRYETLKQDFHAPKEDPNKPKIRIENVLVRSPEELQRLSDFRLENPKDCFGNTSQLTVKDLLKRREDQRHVCEFLFHLSEREILDALHKNETGQVVCPKCKKVLSTGTRKKIPIITSSTNNRFVLEVHPGREADPKRNIKPKLPHYSSRLTLSYQKMRY